MKYEHVCVESFAYTLPEEVLTTAELERRLEPVYRRLKLPEGRLELMTGIRERRLWPEGMLPGEQSARTVQSLLDRTGFDPGKIGALIHGSVCRDYLEPATACGVHRRLRLPDACVIFDISNACLGIVSGMVQIANMIELGEIEAGIVVGTETSRSLMNATIRYLNTNPSVDRQNIKKAFASLTIGSGSAAVLLVHRSLSSCSTGKFSGAASSVGRRLLGGVVHSNSVFSDLCQSDTDRSGGDAMDPLMWTDSEKLMLEGVNTAKTAFGRFLQTVGWTNESPECFFTHQVGRKHQQLLFDSLEIPLARNFSTLEILGNTGSAALPTAAAMGIEQGFALPDQRIALLGIGSGINVIMLALQ